jgi:hypothetical protein
MKTACRLQIPLKGAFPWGTYRFNSLKLELAPGPFQRDISNVKSYSPRYSCDTLQKNDLSQATRFHRS